MGCEFREQMRERVLAKPDTYDVAQVKPFLEQLVSGIGAGGDQLVRMVPSEMGGYRLRGKFDAPKPRWRSERLDFKVGFKVQASFLFWIDVIEVTIGGNFQLRNKGDRIEQLDANMELRFDAMDEAIRGLEGRVPLVEGQPPPQDTCQAVQSLLSQQVTQFLRQVRDETRKQLQQFKR